VKHKVVDRESFEKAHAAFLQSEKELTRQRDELARRRRELPWSRVEKSYRFEGSEGTRTLADLFAGKHQLIVQHFMFGPGWKEGCEGCSFMADHVDGLLAHLRQRDASFVAVSRAPLAEIQKYQKRMGWRFPWYSSNGTDFNFDFHVSFTEGEKAEGRVYYNYSQQDFSSEELPGLSVFYRDEDGGIFHTYSTFARGTEQVMGAYAFMDLLPMGRNEQPFKVHPMEWVRRHDEYEGGPKQTCCH
jgi:predicted dithiol-disulfide oxidoreductase (DUF899 family)